MSDRFIKLRKEYLKNSLSEDSVVKSPFEQFDLWFNEAINSEILHANAMTLATTSAQGYPDARIVLLKEIKNEGFYFFTNYLSTKGRQLDSNNAAALLFFWPELERQVRLRGFVQKADGLESDNYFQSRPRAANVSAINSPQSEVIESREWLMNRQKEFESAHESLNLTRPSYWGGYVFVPREFEFWQGRENRLHDRIHYRRNNETKEWKIERLAP